MTVKENLEYLKYFGFNLTFWKTVNHVAYTCSKGKMAWWIKDKNHNAIENYLREVCAPVVEDMRNGNMDNKEDIQLCTSDISKGVKKNQTIWTMWWQGEDSAPPIVRACIESMRKYGGGRDVVVLDKDNYMDYVYIPEIIMNRLEEGRKDMSLLKNTVLSLTHFSDIVRVLLLYQYGGLWMDSTILLTDNLPDCYFREDFVTLGEDNLWYVGKGKWSSFFLGAKEKSPIMHFVFNMHNCYLQKKEYYVSYLMIYNMFHILYCDRPDIAAIMDQFEHGNKETLTVNRKYDEAVDLVQIKEFLEHQHVHKLSWRWWGNDLDSPLLIKDKDGNITWFGYVYQLIMDTFDCAQNRDG